MRGVPGTVGGAVRMNAGAYEREISDVLETATVVSDRGAVHVLANEELGFSYRHCNLAKDWIVTSVVLRGIPDEPDAIKARMADVSDSRQRSQPIKERTGGSTFKNPSGKSAWELIDQAGCRGMTIGGARVSDHHCNFMINTGKASAADLESLGQRVRQTVLEKTGVELEWEIQIIGEKTADGGIQ